MYKHTLKYLFIYIVIGDSLRVNGDPKPDNDLIKGLIPNDPLENMGPKLLSLVVNGLLNIPDELNEGTPDIDEPNDGIRGPEDMLDDGNIPLRLGIRGKERNGIRGGVGDLMSGIRRLLGVGKPELKLPPLGNEPLVNEDSDPTVPVGPVGENGLVLKPLRVSAVGVSRSGNVGKPKADGIRPNGLGGGNGKPGKGPTGEKEGRLAVPNGLPLSALGGDIPGRAPGSSNCDDIPGRRTISSNGDDMPGRRPVSSNGDDIPGRRPISPNGDEGLCKSLLGALGKPPVCRA